MGYLKVSLMIWISFGFDFDPYWNNFLGTCTINYKN